MPQASRVTFTNNILPYCHCGFAGQFDLQLNLRSLFQIVVITQIFAVIHIEQGSPHYPTVLPVQQIYTRVSRSLRRDKLQGNESLIIKIWRSDRYVIN
jgi:hypothetical protein